MVRFGVWSFVRILYICPHRDGRADIRTGEPHNFKVPGPAKSKQKKGRNDGSHQTDTQRPQFDQRLSRGASHLESHASSLLLEGGVCEKEGRKSPKEGSRRGKRYYMGFLP